MPLHLSRSGLTPYRSCFRRNEGRRLLQIRAWSSRRLDIEAANDPYFDPEKSAGAMRR